MPRSNERGITLVEVLATLVLSSLTIGLLIFISSQVYHSVAQGQMKEAALQQSREIVQQLSSHVRKGFLPVTDGQFPVSSQALVLRSCFESVTAIGGEENAYITYEFDNENKKLLVNLLLEDEDGNLPDSPQRFVYDKYIEDVHFKIELIKGNNSNDANPSRKDVYAITLDLVIKLPNNRTEKTATTVHTTYR